MVSKVDFNEGMSLVPRDRVIVEKKAKASVEKSFCKKNGCYRTFLLKGGLIMDNRCW
jgi:hypothetical protein